MRDYVIADNQDITKAGILFLLGGLKDVGNITEANNRAELIKELRTSDLLPDLMTYHGQLLEVIFK